MKKLIFTITILLLNNNNPMYPINNQSAAAKQIPAKPDNAAPACDPNEILNQRQERIMFLSQKLDEGNFTVDLYLECLALKNANFNAPEWQKEDLQSQLLAQFKELIDIESFSNAH